MSFHARILSMGILFLHYCCFSTVIFVFCLVFLNPILVGRRVKSIPLLKKTMIKENCGRPGLNFDGIIMSRWCHYDIIVNMTSFDVILTMTKNDDTSRKLALSLTSNLIFFLFLNNMKAFSFPMGGNLSFNDGNIATWKMAKFYQYFGKIRHKFWRHQDDWWPKKNVHIF